MPLTIYRRHSTDCNVHTLKIGKRKLTTEEKRAYQDCDCAIWVYGTTEKNELYPRQTLKTRDWATAEARVRTIDAGAKDEKVYGPTIEECIQKYLDSREEEIGTKTLNQFRLVLWNLKDVRPPPGQASHARTERRPGCGLQNVQHEDARRVHRRERTFRKLKSFLTEAGFRGLTEKPVKVKTQKVQASAGAEPFYGCGSGLHSCAARHN